MDIGGRSPESFVHADDSERVRRRIAEGIEDRESTEPMEERLIGVGDEERVDESASATATNDGVPTVPVVMNDVIGWLEHQPELEGEQLRKREVIRCRLVRS